jgi:hypothetical protein
MTGRDIFSVGKAGQKKNRSVAAQGFQGRSITCIHNLKRRLAGACLTNRRCDLLQCKKHCR